MKKRKLPSNWVTVNSKSHPDRIYYFNTKTNKSTWIQPTETDTVNKESSEPSCKRRKNYDEKEEHSKAMTPKRNSVGDEIVQNQKSQRNKRSSQTAEKIVQEKETPQMKILREKILQKQKMQTVNTKSKSSEKGKAYASVSSSPRKSSRQIENNNTVVSSSRRSLSEIEGSNKTDSLQSKSSLSKLVKNKSSVIPHKIESITLTPQMRVLYEKIQQKKSGGSNLNPKTKNNFKVEQQPESTNKILTRTQEKQERTVSRSKADNLVKKDTKLYHSQTKKNLAKERMQRLQRSLSLDRKKIQDSDCSVIEKSLEIFNKTLPVVSSKSLENHKNIETRLKRLHNKILKEAMNEKNTALNNNKLGIQQSKESNHTMTKEKLIKQATEEVFCEEMDWEPMKDEEITLEVEVLRTQLSGENCTNVTDNISNNIENVIQSLDSSQGKGPLYIVIDTNVFLTNLEIIEEARDATFKTYPRPFIIIPWTVIRELDYLKSDKSKSESLRLKARKAISFINEHFASKHPRIIGQTRDQAAKNKVDFSIDCPDDEILQCCLQISKLQKSVVLMSYDKNFCNKAMTFNIMTLGRNDPLEKIDYWNASDIIINPLSNNTVENMLFNEELSLSDDIYANTREIMKDFLSTIIVKQMSEIYGAEWEIYVIIKPPWNIVAALKCAIKHWIAAISESFDRRSLLIIKELLHVFEHLPVGGRKLQDVENILEKCSELIEAANSEKHCNLVFQSLSAIMELKEKCTKCIVDINIKKQKDKLGIVENEEEQKLRMERALQCFKQIYNYTRDFCGMAANVAGKVFPLNFNPLNPPLSPLTTKRLQPNITKRVVDLTQSLNKLLMQTEYNSIRYQTLLTLQQDMHAFASYTETVTANVELLDIFCCVKLKEDVLQIGLRQFQELSTHYRALY